MLHEQAQKMNAYSPIHAYAIGAVGIGLGLHACLRPRQEYPRFGLRLESAQPPHPREKASIATPEKSNPDAGSVSPLIYLKAIRESSYGLALIGLQLQDNAAGVTTVAACVALAALGDGFVVWYHGGREARRKAWGHWAAFVGLAGWTGWRTFLWYGQLAAFHALHV